MKKDVTTGERKSSGRRGERERRGGIGARRMNPNAAGIDIGSREHYVAVPPDRDAKPVRTFGCTTPDLHEMARWLKACRVDTVAMESTGVYWIPVAQVLEQHGLKVVLVDARHLKNVPGRKSDVLDCQWLQELHLYGLLSGAFRPEPPIQVLRSYWRQREGVVASCAQQIHLMHKALEQMNVQLHKALSDVTGTSGMAMLRAIVAGERDAATLARMRDWRVKRTEVEMIKALTGNYRSEHVFALKQALAAYDFHQGQLAELDVEIERCMRTFDTKADPATLSPAQTRRPRRKNQPHFDLRRELHRVTGVDLTRIDGIAALTAQTVISEIGVDVNAFPTSKHFASWLTLCPNNQVTGGKVRSRHILGSANRVAHALRVAAQSLHHSRSALGACFRRMRARLGAPKAITATAHKLAVRIYHMLRYGEAYVDQGEEIYEAQQRERLTRSLKKRAKELGLELLDPATGVVVS